MTPQKRLMIDNLFSYHIRVLFAKTGHFANSLRTTPEQHPNKGLKKGFLCSYQSH